MNGLGVILGQYVRRALAYRWLVMVPAVLVFALVTFYLTLQPNTYESHAVLMQPMTKPGEGGNAEHARQVRDSVLRSATERMLSTNMLLKVVETVDPYPTVRTARGTDAAIEKLRRNIRLDVNRRSGVITLFATHSGGERPAETAADIVNTLTDLFVKSQRDAIEDKVTFLQKFYNSEKVRLRKARDHSRNAVAEFKAAHAGELPDDIPANEAKVDRLRQQIVDHKQTQRQYQFQVNALNRELARLDTELVLLRERGYMNTNTARDATKRLVLGLELELKDLLFRFKADHPQVERKKAQIEAIRAQIEEGQNETENASLKKREEYMLFLMDENKKLIKRFETEFANLDTVVGEADKEIEVTQARIMTGTRLDAQYTALVTDLAESQAKYDGILNKQAQAERDALLTRHSATVPIQVEQSAFVPAKPASPDRLVTSLIGLMLGLSIGVGLAIVHAKLDRSYHRPEDLRALLPGAVLVTIPEVRATSVRVGRALLGVLGGLILLALFASTVAVLGVQLGWWGQAEMISFLTQLR